MDATGEAPRGTTVVPTQQLAERFAALRAAWLEVAADLATVGPVNELLMTRLDSLEEIGVASENDLLCIAEDAAQVALQVTTAEGARTLSKRLRRAVYEYLLALDATVDAAAVLEAQPVAAASPSARPGSMMIGLEEVAEAQPQPAPDGPDGAWTLDAPAGADADPAAGVDDLVLAESVVLTVPAGIEDGNGGGHNGASGEGLEEEHEGPPVPDETEALAAGSDEAEPGGIATSAGAEVGDEGSGSADAPSDSGSDEGAAPTLAAGLEVDAERLSEGEPEPDRAEAGEDGDVGEPAAIRRQLVVIRPEDAPAASEPLAGAAPGPAAAAAEPTAAAPEPVAAALDPAAAAPAPPVPAARPDGSRVPPRVPRETPPPPAAVVVPSYRAWADVIAAATEPEPAPATAPPPPPPSPEEDAPDGAAPDAKAAEPEARLAVLADPDQPLLVDVPIFDPQSLEQPAPAAADPPQDRAQDWPDGVVPENGGGSAADLAETGGWSVRKSPRQQLLSARMAEKRRAQAVQAAEEAIALAEADNKGGRRRRERAPEPLNPGAIPLQVDELVHRKKGADAAALLQRAAQELGGPELTELAMVAGDRLRELGQTKPAINCYLAGWRADPLNEAPLWRLAETCLSDHSDHSVEQGVGYLERIADLMRARGDDEGAIAVYRRILTVAPHTKEVREVLRHVHATGRLLD
ncbi:MAG TPA: hypothetical protein VI316_12305 [Candidatus Dormibacteraeota bacterium]